MIRQSLVFRRVARTLAAVQLLLSAAAPLLETASLASPQPQASVMAPDTQPSNGRAVHDPANCPACQLLRLSAWKPEPTHLVLADVVALAAADFSVVAAPTPAPRGDLHSRAPPSLPV